MKFKRWKFLVDLGGSAGAIALDSLWERGKNFSMPFTVPATRESFSFQLIKSSILRQIGNSHFSYSKDYLSFVEIAQVGHKYNCTVKAAPAKLNHYNTKRTWWSCWHEFVRVKSKQLAFYLTRDRPKKHLGKFVSHDLVNNPPDKANYQLLQNGTLYPAKFNLDGTGS